MEQQNKFSNKATDQKTQSLSLNAESREKPFFPNVPLLLLVLVYFVWAAIN
jgi:hypothetical protein